MANPRVYLDICAIQRPLDDPAQLRVRLEAEAVLGILEACAAGMLSLVASDAHFAEAGRNPHPNRRDFTYEVLRLAAGTVGISESVASRARGYTLAGIAVPDALHLASAVEARVDFFCTTDDRLLKKGRVVNTDQTSVVTPLELATSLEQP